jgi:cation transport ATPase
MEDLTQDATELRRTTYIAALWFAAALLSGTVTTAILLAGGWRPYRLDVLPGATWLAATAVAAAGTVLLAWAGCPVFPREGATEHHRKSLTIRVGIVAFLAGTAVASSVELFSPALHA